MKSECPLCNKWVSEWEILTGKTVIIEGKIVHVSCVQHLSITEALRGVK